MTTDTVVIGHLGRLAREKNLPFLARSVAAVLQQDKQLAFLIAGTGDVEQEMDAIFRDAGVDDQVHFVGNITGQDLADCYGAMDLFVFASQSETQGLVLAEAMAAATQVVALSDPGVDDVVEEGVNGILLPGAATEEEFSRALQRALQDDGLHGHWQRGTRETARRYSRRAAAESLATLTMKPEPGTIEIDLLDVIFNTISAEWELLQEKAAALTSLAEAEKDH